MTDDSSTDLAAERAVKVCPQCEGEGGYPDGLDEAACYTDCTRCDGNGFIVDLAALRQSNPAQGWRVLESIVRYHESGGHKGDGSDETLAAARQELAFLSTAVEAGNEVERERALSVAAKALLDDVHRRYPGEELRCEYMRALEAALNQDTEQ